MVDFERRVCCMCGDVGFFDKLFHCIKCLNRFQHSYCSNYYREEADPIKICDWCQCEAKSRSGAPKHGVNGGPSSKRSYRSEYSSADHHQIKQQEINQINNTSSSNPPAADKGKTGVPSPRPATRRYKLLKDVMC